MSRWFRFYNEALDDPKVQQLDPVIFKHWVNLLCIACRHEGKLPSHEAMAFSLRLDIIALESLLDRLLIAGLIDVRKGGANGSYIAPHGWDKRQYKSDTSTERVKRFRNVSVTAIETPPETETETETEGLTANAIKPKRARDNFPDWLPLEAWQGFLEMRKGKGVKPTPRATGLLIAKLDRLRASGHDPGTVLDQSTENNWTGIFEVKENGNQNIRNGGGNGPDKRSGLAKALDGIIAGELC